MTTLDKLSLGQWARISQVGGEGQRRQHFLDMGLIPGAALKLVKFAPMGDPVEILVHGYSLTLRLADAGQIMVKPTPDPESQGERVSNIPYIVSLHEHNSHPGIGESGKYHSKDHASPLPKNTTLTFALAGQQNCGKTTLFNQLTGSKQHVGNFPGVTVDRKDGTIRSHPETLVTDLPGIYSLSPYTAEELVSRQFLLNEHPKGIINIVDANNIERNLYLTMQLMELDVPMVLALNMMDEVRNNGGSIRVNEMENILGIPVVPISAAKNEGVSELVEHALHVAKFQERPARHDFCDKESHNGALHRCLHGIMHFIEDHAQRANIPVRFAASKLVEGDTDIMEALQLTQNEKETIEHMISQMEEERGLDRAAAMADMRFDFISRLCSRTVVKPQESKEYRRSLRIDRILTGKWTALPIFLAVMGLVIYLSVGLLGAPLQQWLDQGIGALAGSCASTLKAWNVSSPIRSLVVDGIFGGVGCVVSFMPIIILLFFFLSILEDSGYMARVAFVTDKLLRHFGLSGRSIVPLLIGFGCSVPGVMAARTLPSVRDRRLTIMLVPFMSCSAKIPIYAFFSSVFFPHHAALVVIALYLLGIAVGLLVAMVSKWLRSDKEAAPFVMELPNYRLPTPKNVGHLLYDKTKDFLSRAFTVIFAASIVIWFFQTFDFHFNMVDGGEGSMLATMAGVIAPIFNPMGLGSWQIVTSLVSGFLAKETVVATLQVLGGVSLITPVSAIAMLVFCLLYTPCVAAIAAIRRELGGGWALLVIVFQCAIAWLFSWLAFLVASCFIA